MTKNVEITIDIDIARRMLKVTGYYDSFNMTEDEVFEKVLSMINKYGVASIILNSDNNKETERVQTEE